MSYYGEYSYSPAMDSEVMGVLMIYMIVLLIGGIYGLVCYIIKGVGLYTIAKRQGAEYPWLAFVPFARTYLQGELGGDILLKKKYIRNPGIWLIVLPVIEGIAVFVFYLLIFGIIGFSAFSSMNYYGPGAGTIVLLVVMFLLFLLVMIGFAGMIQVLKILVNHQILERFTTRNMSIVHAVLMGMIPMYEPVCLLIMSRKPYNPGMEPQNVKPFMQTPPPAPEAGEPGIIPQRGLLNPETSAEQEPEAAENMKLEVPQEPQNLEPENCPEEEQE